MKIHTAEELSSLLRFSPHPRRALTDGWVVFTILDLDQLAGEGKVDGEGRPEDMARRVKRPSRVEAGGAAGEGWWELASGIYHARYNERLAAPPGSLLVLQPHPYLLANGVWHLPLLLRSEKDLEEGVMLVVAARGVKLRENAPLSRGMLVE
jgi:hypothetical protein